MLLGVTHAAGHKKNYVLWSWARKREFSIIEQGSVKAWGKGQRTKNGCIKSGSLLCSLIKRRSIRTKLVTFSTNLSLGRGRLGSCGTAQHICMADRDKCWLITCQMKNVLSNNRSQNLFVLLKACKSSLLQWCNITIISNDSTQIFFLIDYFSNSTTVGVGIDQALSVMTAVHHWSCLHLRQPACANSAVYV